MASKLEERKKEWREAFGPPELKSKERARQDLVLKMLEEGYRQGWGDCYDAMMQVSSAERADMQADRE